MKNMPALWRNRPYFLECKTRGAPHPKKWTWLPRTAGQFFIQSGGRKIFLYRGYVKLSKPFLGPTVSVPKRRNLWKLKQPCYRKRCFGHRLGQKLVWCAGKPTSFFRVYNTALSALVNRGSLAVTATAFLKYIAFVFFFYHQGFSCGISLWHTAGLWTGTDVLTCAYEGY